MLGLALPTRGMARTTHMRIEPKTFFANERTFLAWLNMAVTLGSIAAALLGFSAGSDGSGSEGLSRHMVEVIALILLPLAMAMCVYALYIFLWRAGNIARKRAVHFDDRVRICFGAPCLAHATVWLDGTPCRCACMSAPNS